MVIKCAECGSIMSSVFTNKLKKGKTMRYYYYRCTSVDKHDRSFCGIKQIGADRIDKLIINYLDNTVKNNQYLDSLILRSTISKGATQKDSN